MTTDELKALIAPVEIVWIAELEIVPAPGLGRKLDLLIRRDRSLDEAWLKPAHLNRRGA